MSDNVISFETRDGLVGAGITVDIDAVLDAAKECVEVLVIGVNKEGDLYLATSHADKAPILLIRALQQL